MRLTSSTNEPSRHDEDADRPRGGASEPIHGDEIADRVPDYLLRLGNPAVGLCCTMSRWAIGAVILWMVTTITVSLRPSTVGPPEGLALAILCAAAGAGVVAIMLLRGWQVDAMVSGRARMSDPRLRVARWLVLLMWAGAFVEFSDFRTFDPVRTALQLLLPPAAYAFLQPEWQHRISEWLHGIIGVQLFAICAMLTLNLLKSPNAGLLVRSQPLAAFVYTGILIAATFAVWATMYRIGSLHRFWKKRGLVIYRDDLHLLRMRFPDAALRKLPCEVILQALPLDERPHMWLIQLVARLRREHGLPYFEPDLAPEDRDTNALQAPTDGNRAM